MNPHLRLVAHVNRRRDASHMPTVSPRIVLWDDAEFTSFAAMSSAVEGWPMPGIASLFTLAAVASVPALLFRETAQ